MKKILILVILIIIATFTYQFIDQNLLPFIKKPASTQDNIATIRINGATYKISVADNEVSRAQGLSGKQKLEKDEGLLFLFPQKDKYGFWMKDMLFPIDIIWLDEDVIADISHSVQIPLSPTYVPSYYPKAPVNKVLEVNAGEAKKNNFTIGQKVTINLFKPL